MTTLRPCTALLTFALTTAALAQPTLERTACIHPTAKAGDGLSLALAAADWDGDGFDDLAFGTPLEDYPSSGQVDQGAFRTFEIGSNTVTPFDGIAGATDDRLGGAIAAGDFDGDDLPEFAVGAPGAGGGTVVVRERSGFFAQQLGITLVQGSSGISGVSEDGDGFGAALAAGDFDDDGFDDLAVGVPSESWDPTIWQGAVQVFYGSATGLTGARDFLFGQDQFTGQTREFDDRFGSSLAAGDLDGDGYADLAIGAPSENEGSLEDSGVVHVVFGSATGLDFTRQQTWSQSDSGVASSPEEFDQFGKRVAIGDFDRTSLVPIRRDLAISVPCESDGSIGCAGAVHILYSDTNGPSATGAQFFLRPGGSAEDALFGRELLATDLDGDTAADLVVGAAGPAYAPPPGFEATGEAHLFFGFNALSDPRDLKLRSSGLPPWRPLSGACFDAGVAAHDFAGALAAADFDNDGKKDLAIAIPGWSNSVSDNNLGAVEILFGSNALFRDGFETADNGRWSSAVP